METTTNRLYPQYDAVTVKNRPQQKRKYYGLSMTIPDQTMSIREILKRFTRGLPINGTDPNTATYDESEIPNLKTLDLVELHDLSKGYSEEIRAIETKMMEAKTKKEKEALKNEIRAQFEKEAAEKLAAEQAAKNTNNT